MGYSRIESVISGIYGPESWFVIGGVLVFISAILLLIVPSIRKCDEPETRISKSA